MRAASAERGMLVSEAASRWAAVLVPWALSRGALFLIAERAVHLRDRHPAGPHAFAVWDGPWYADIAAGGYGWAHSNGETPYPFFPLLPALLRLGSELGLSAIDFGALLNHVVFLVALLGLYEITRERFGASSAALAAWSLALFPGSAPFTMVYPESIFLACAVWGFHAVERGRDGRAALLAALAALVRPNGLVVALGLALAAALESRSWRRPARLALPAAACVALWMAWLWATAGDPLAFVHAKSAWHEVTLLSILEGRDPVPLRDLAPLGFAVVVLAATWRRLPAAWLGFAALCLLPSLALGILGMPRYTSVCFPVFAAFGTLLARWPLPLRVAALGTSAVLLLLFAERVFLLESMP
jgi:hypothetical protein